MNYFKRGITSVIRKPGKSAILLILIFVLGNIIAGAVSVKGALANTQNAMLNKMGAEVKIEMDMEKLFNEENSNVDFDNIKSPALETIDKIGKSKYIKYYDYKTTTYLESSQFANYTPKGQNSNTDENYSGNNTVYFNIIGGQNPIIADIEKGKAKLIDGRTFTKEEIDNGDKVILISKNLAEKNGINIGSKISLEKNIYNYGNFDGSTNLSGNSIQTSSEPEKKITFDFTVIGLFEPVKSATVDKNGKLKESMSSLENVVYTTNSVVNECNEKLKKAEQEINPDQVIPTFNDMQAIFLLKNFNDLESFKTENSTYLPKFYKFTDNSDMFKNVETPMANMQWIAKIVLYVAIGATILIISLLVTLFLRDRKHEMGIYLSLGEKKSKIVSQILVEVMLIAVIAISFSLFSGNMLAKNMSAKMLENQIVSEQENSVDNESMYDGMVIMGEGMSDNTASISADNVMKIYSVNLNGNIILFIYLVALGTVFVSTIVPIIYTLRLNPKKILL